MNAKIATFLEERRPETPCLVLDLDVVAGNYQALAEALPDSRIFYAVKANPAPQILSLLAAMGSCFDTASVVEIHDALAAGATADRISFGNTIKKRVDIATAYALGIRLFAFDSEAELRKIAEVAPGARVFCRILTSGEGAEWPLSRKFGCEPCMARDLLAMAPGLGLDAYGVSFHVGSQQRDTGAWDKALESAAGIFRDLAAQGIELKMVNLGGGFPTKYLKEVPTPDAYGRAITNGRIKAAAPFLRMTKEDVWRYGQNAGLPMGITYSCERGGRKPCGRCASCRDRKKASTTARSKWVTRSRSNRTDTALSFASQIK